MMKKVIIMICFMLPMLLVAQTSSTKGSPEKSKRSDFRPVIYTYMIMEFSEKSKAVVSPKSKKKSKNLEVESNSNYTFSSNDKTLDSKLNKLSSEFKSELDALSLLGEMGWHLVQIKGNNYYFMTNRRR
jgi:hypothetical protein